MLALRQIDHLGSFASVALRTRIRLSPISDMSGGHQIRRDMPIGDIGRLFDHLGPHAIRRPSGR